MSATNRGAKRRKKDNYPTPPWATDRFLDAYPIYRSERVLSPTAGDGAILGRLVKRGHSKANITAIDIRSECKTPLRRVADNVMISDFLKIAPTLAPEKGALRHRYDLILDNPPFLIALEILQACWDLAPRIAFLLRKGFLASAERNEWLRMHVPDVYALPNRPPFLGDGKTDATDYAWMVWRTGVTRVAGRIRLLPTTPLDERRKARAPVKTVAHARGAR